MDNILEHPGIELQVLIKEKGLTQKAFSSILGKKVSEVNELLKGKRNITIQRDYLLHQTLGTPIKYWILKQIDYDYSLLDIEENDNSPLLIGKGQDEVSEHQTDHSELEGRENPELSPLRDGKSHKSSLPGEDLDGAVGDTAKPREFEQPQETPIKEPDSKDDEDLKNRANIFRTF